MKDKGEGSFKAPSRDEENLLKARAEEIASLVTARSRPALTDFLTPPEQGLVEQIWRRMAVVFRWDGGFPEAERRRGLVVPETWAVDQVDSQVVVLKIQGNFSFFKAGHRDFLGAIMSLGIRREKFGDLATREGECLVAAERQVAGFLASTLNHVGPVPVSVAPVDSQDQLSGAVKAQEKSITVASLRLDAVLGAVFGLSRSKAARAIAAEQVEVNWSTVSEPDLRLRQGDMISFRRHGRVELEECVGQTSKGRSRIRVKKLT